MKRYMFTWFKRRDSLVVEGQLIGIDHSDDGEEKAIIFRILEDRHSEECGMIVRLEGLQGI